MMIIGRICRVAVALAAAATLLLVCGSHSALASDGGCAPTVVQSLPSGFDPLNATDAQLEAAGLPPRQPDPGWLDAMEHLKQVVPGTVGCNPLPVRHDYVSDNWAGHVVPHCNVSCSTYFTHSSADWIQPTVPSTNDNPTPYESVWVGTGNNDLIQTGCDSVASNPAQYNCWYEDYPEAAYSFGPSISPGDQIYAYEQYHSNNGTAYYYIENVTTGQAQGVTEPAPYDGNSAANFILELTCVCSNNKGVYLPAFSSPGNGNKYLTWNAWYGDDSNSWALNSHSTQIWGIYANSNGTGLLAEPGTMGSNNSFWNYWYGSGPVNW
jgi:hypothetical protein